MNRSKLYELLQQHPRATRAEVRAHAALYLLAEKWRLRNEREKVLKSCFDKTFTKT